jgi:ParB family chromosome partitioning protein
MSKNNKGLGMGLAALIGNNNEFMNKNNIIPPPIPQTENSNILMLPITTLKAGPFQPRTNFNEQYLQELAVSIKENGVISPIIIRSTDKGYEIIAGERRWRASKLAGLKEVPVIIKNISDQKALEVSIVENVQRQDLTPIEEAEAIKRLMNEFNYSHENISTVLGKSRSHVTNLLRLLKLPSEVQEMLSKGEISMGHARSLVTLENPLNIAKQIIKESLSVRQVEDLTRNLNPNEAIKPRSKKTANNNIVEVDEDLIELEQELTRNLGLKVSISYDAGITGKLSIDFNNLEQLDKIIRLLNNNSSI